MSVLERFFCFLIVAVFGLCATGTSAFGLPAVPGITYTNVVVAEVPWSIHIVKIARTNLLYEIQSRHAGGGALGMSTLSDQVAAIQPAAGKAVAGINGGFYLRDNGRADAYAGCSRDLQVVEGEVLSAPAGNACFWIDLVGDAHVANVASHFEVTWPDGRATPFGLNGERGASGVVLYTPAVGASTRTAGGRELVLEPSAGSRWLPLRMGRNYSARVREIREAGNSPMSPGIMILSIAPGSANQFQAVKPGDLLRISTASTPSLLAARTALSGGPLLVSHGQRQKIQSSPGDAYELSSMLERHPRAAVGWNADWYFLVEVDGRQRDLSEGMTLDELAALLVKLGCDDALNLDGGGSATLWFDGSVRNSPCDGYERPIANSLVVVQKPAKPATQTAARNPTGPVESFSQK